MLDANRKNFIDEDGVYFGRMLERNNGLVKLDLEGNMLGSKAASAIGRAILVNSALMCLDLSQNRLAEDGDKEGFFELADSLAVNTTLLNLNISNCDLDADCGRRLLEALSQNRTLVQIDYSMN